MAKKKTTKRTNSSKSTSRPTRRRPRTGPVNNKPGERPQANAEPSRCQCGSTGRTPYDRKPEVTRVRGIRDGKPYTRIERRLTQCTSCNQFRYDISYHNQPKVDFPTAKP